MNEIDPWMSLSLWVLYGIQNQIFLPLSVSPPMKTLFFRFLLNFLNTNACNTKIEEEKKKLAIQRWEGNRVHTRHHLFPCQNYTTRTGKGNLKVHARIAIWTWRELPPISFSFFSFFLRSGYGYELWISFEKFSWVDFNLGIWVTLDFDFWFFEIWGYIWFRFGEAKTEK